MSILKQINWTFLIAWLIILFGGLGAWYVVYLFIKLIARSIGLT